MTPRIFLLSPAHAGGERARLLFSERAGFDLAVRLRHDAAPLDEVFAFVSGLYFRGKLAYCRAFANPPPGAPPALVIAAGRGLSPPETPITLEDLRRIAAVPIDAADPRYREPLERDALALARFDCPIVLLGSIATRKYIEPLLNIFEQRLWFPSAFVGRGDMSRGGLMLRCARAGVELDYTPVLGAPRHGPRPSRLPRMR